MKKYLLLVAFMLIASTCYGNNTVALVIAGEASGEGRAGMTAVACVIQNRMELYHKTAYQVVTQKKQFSVLSSPAIMRANYKHVKSWVDHLQKMLESKTYIQDITGGATHYVTKSLYEKKKYNRKHWINRMAVTKIIGNHVFMVEPK